MVPTTDIVDGASVAEVRRLLGRYGLHPRKALGQHFLVDPAALGRIVEAAELGKDDTVIEVGPGPGLLTRGLLDGAGRVVAVEKDARLAGLLRREISHSRLHILAADVLNVPPEDLLSNTGGGTDYKVVANLPYYAAAPILRHFLEARVRPKLLVVLLQEEVARTVVAKPGDMTMLSVGMQLYAVPRMIGPVSASSFYPPPKVESAIVRLDVRPEPAVSVEPQRYFEVVRAGFSAPRKQIVNSLAKGIGAARPMVLEVLTRAGVSPQRRAETLSLEEWAAICEALEAVG